MRIPAGARTILVASGFAVCALALSAVGPAAHAQSADRDTAGRDRVRSEDLPPPGADPPRVVGDRKDGFGNDLWRGASRNAVAKLLPRLPEAPRSWALGDLARRLLNSVAAPPDDGRKAGILTLRLRQLYAMGAVADLKRLHKGAETPYADPRRAPALVGGLMMAGAIKEACAATAAFAKGGVTPFLEEARIVCLARAREFAKAALAVELMRERGHPRAGRLAALLDAAAGRGPGPVHMPKPTAIDVALLGLGKARIPPDAIARAPLSALQGIASLKNPPRTARIAAAERLARAGVLPEGQLAALYAGAAANPQAVAGAHRIPLREYGAKARLLLYQAAADAKDTQTRVLKLAAWWRLAVAAGDERLAARLTAPLLIGVRPDRRWQDNAAHIARVYYWTGRFKRAHGWYAVLRSAPFRNPDDLHRLTAVAALAAPAKPEELRAWAAYRRRAGAAAARDKLVRLYALMDGLGRADAYRAIWDAAKISSAALPPAPPAWRAIEVAARAGRRGEAVLRLLVSAGAGDPATLDPAIWRAAVASLRAAGFVRDARALAVELALASGL